MKQKYWKVSVFNKTIESIKNDMFYTTDTEAYLIFELIDEEFTPESAVVTIYNIYGKATVNANVEVADGIIRYEMPDEAIGHSGGWRTQVVYTKDNEDYTTGIIEFEVGGHLLDNKKPAIVDIENWNSFITHARELIDDWEQLEEIRQANEQQRELAESVRQNEFEANETERQTEFETNETERESTFNINESARQANELARESAESVRVANEEERELSEAERISKDSERDSRIDSKADVSELELYAKKEQEEWITPTLLNGWYAIRPLEPPQYMKDEFGFVHFRGTISKGASATSNVAFQLPIGYRPRVGTTFSMSEINTNSRTIALTIFTNGNVDFAGSPFNSWYGVSSITFKAV